jgi:predicted esterase
VRSFNAKEYTGFDESANLVLKEWSNQRYDIILGHSQGAILIASLLALQRQPYHPRIGYIMNGVSFPNPYKHSIESLGEEEEQQQTTKAPPKILFIFGKRDKITPNSSGEQLRDGLSKGGLFDVTSCYHDGGHGFPDDDDDNKSMTIITNWINRNQQSQSQ